MEKNRALDMNKIKKKPSREMLTKEALSDVKKIEWSESVRKGTKKVIVNKASE
ncbi:MAG: hypothetical protein J6W35_03505 [Eubacterium sp.]|nr:hypothetical protein [Eubacterium sp.]